MNEDFSRGFPWIPRIAPGVAPKIVVFVLLNPKGRPFHTKNVIVMKIVVFCYRGSILLSYRITIAVVIYYP